MTEQMSWQAAEGITDVHIPLGAALFAMAFAHAAAALYYATLLR